jgi:hypothetical protein
MKMPPYLVAMRVVEQERTKFKIWFPLFLLWPLVLPFVLLTLIATVVVDGIRFLAGQKGAYTRLAVGVLGIVGETRGTEVFIQDNAHTVAFRLR